MARPKGSKNKEARTESVVTNAPQVEPVVEPVIENRKVTPKDEKLVLVKTVDRDVVVAANKMKYEVVHISGSGTVHSPKVFYLKVMLSKLSEEVGERINNVEPAEISEIAHLVNASRERGLKESADSRAQKRKLNVEIKPSEFYA